MFNTIVLLTGAIEQPVLGDVLRRSNPLLTIRPAATLADLDAIESRLLQRARLVAFATSVMVPGRILNALGYGAYNFHAGPPNYPGRTPAHFAIYDHATEFGTTAHAMIERIDAGPIVDIERFAIPPNTDVMKLSELAYAHMARMFWRLVKDLATRAEPLPALPIKWSGQKSSTSLYARMCDIPAAIAKDDLNRRIAAFGAGHFGIDPTVTLHGYRFHYVRSDALATAEAPAIVPDQPIVEAAEQYSLELLPAKANS